jgi:multidrug transporter EmrE-like cation transporter
VSTPTTITFTPLPTYAVTFTESGLLNGTAWYVNLTGGPSHVSTGPTMSFSEFNGTYNYTVATTNKSYAAPGGAFTVNGTAVNESVTFTLVIYTVTFTETGLPSGTNWIVTLAGVSQASTTTTITFKESNGTYSWNLSAVAGYMASLSTGSIAVNGAAVQRSIAFTVPTFLGLPEAEGVGYALLGGISAVIVVCAVVVVLLRRRKKATPSVPPTPPTPPEENRPPPP